MRVSRQYRWQLKQIALGRCVICGQPRNLYATHCDSCAIPVRKRSREQRRKRFGIGPKFAQILDQCRQSRTPELTKKNREYGRRRLKIPLDKVILLERRATSRFWDARQDQ